MNYELFNLILKLLGDHVLVGVSKTIVVELVSYELLGDIKVLIRWLKTSHVLNELIGILPQNLAILLSEITRCHIFQVLKIISLFKNDYFAQ